MKAALDLFGVRKGERHFVRHARADEFQIQVRPIDSAEDLHHQRQIVELHLRVKRAQGAERIEHQPGPVRRQVSGGIRGQWIHQQFEQDALKLLVNSRIDDDARMADEMCGAVDYANIPLEHLSELEVQALLHKLLLVKEIDAHHTA